LHTLPLPRGNPVRRAQKRKKLPFNLLERQLFVRRAREVKFS
jgi:hypothetical protein